MNKLTKKEQDALNAAEPQNQNQRLGSRIQEEDQFGLKILQIIQPAGTTGVVTPFVPGIKNYNKPSGSVSDPVDTAPDPDEIFDFTVIDVIVRTESAVASSAVTLKQGSNALSDVIVSAAANAITRAGSINTLYNDFFPKSNPAGYAAAPLTITDSGGATAAARTVDVIVRKN
jgi:hypothetical protein